MNLEEIKLKKRIISLLLCLCMVFSLLPTVVFASETETSTTVYDWNQENACYTSTTDGNEPQPIKYNDNDPDGGLPETLKTLYSNINDAANEAEKAAVIDDAKTAGTITENLANRLKRLVHVYTGDELTSGVSLQDSTVTAKLNGDELVISGTGPLPTYTRYNAAFWAPADNSVAMRPWNTEKLGREVSSVRFAPGITEVGSYAFYYQGRSDITSATFDKNLKLHLPDSLEKMSQATFMSLNASDIAVPSSVETLSTRLFRTLDRLYVLGAPEIVVPSESSSSFAVSSGTTVYAAKGSTLSSASASDITNMTLVEVDAIGACGTEEGYTSELVWMVQGDTLTIAAMDGGDGVMANYTDTPAPWNAYASKIKKVVLGAGVANIGTNAFAGLNSLTNVTVPDSVQIDEDAESPFGATDLNSISFSFNEGSSFAKWLKKNGIDHSADIDKLGRKKLTKATDELFHAYIGETDIAAKMTNDGTLTIYPTYSPFNNTEVPRIEGYRKDNTAFPWFNEAYNKTFDENDYKGSTKDLVGLKEIVWVNGITDTGAYLFNDANDWPEGAVKFRIPDSVTKIGGALIGNKSAGTTCVIPENVTSVGFWFGGKDAKNVYILNPDLTDFPVVKKGENTSSAGDSMARNIGCGFDYTVHVKKDSAAHTRLVTGDYSIQPHTDMGACGVAPYSSEVFWLYDEATKTLTIKGSGAMKDYASAYDAPWAFYDVETVTVDGEITHIGAYAFASLKKIKQENVTLGEGVTVGTNAFAQPDAQGRLPLPLTPDLYYNAYIGDTTIAAKMSTDGVITIYPTDTSKDTKVPGINGYQGDNRAFPWYEAYGSTDFTKDFTGVHASEIREIVFADDLTEIGGYLFNDVRGMPTSVKVRIPDSVTKVGGALVGTKNHGASIATGEQMTDVGFWYAGKATNVYILNPNMTGIPFPATGPNADLTRTIAQATGDKVAVHVKEGSEAYRTLTKDGSVYTKVITHTELGACGVAPYSSETFWTYDAGSKTLTVLGDGAIKDYANASDAPWSSCDVETLVVQDGITRIGNNAFAALKNLKTVNVDGSVTEVADSAFATENGEIVGSLKKTQFLTSSDAMKAWLKKYGTSALGTSGVCDGYRWSIEGSVLTIEVNMADTDTTDALGKDGKTAVIPDITAENTPDWVAYKSIITKVQLGYGITGIGANAFKDMPVLASVELPSTLEKIGAEAFVNTPKLTKLYLPKKAIDVAPTAFGTSSSDAKNLTIQVSPVAPEDQKNMQKTQGNTTITVDDTKNLNVLLIGNSYFGALSGYLKDIAKDRGATDAMIANYYFGGYAGNLKSYVDYINAGKVSYKDNDTYSGYKENGVTNHSYNNNPLSMGIEAEDWDYVVMETWGKKEPAGAKYGDKLSKDPNLTTLKEYILKYAPQAEVSLYHVYSCRYLAEKEEPVETLTEQWQRYVNGADDGLAKIVAHVIPASTLIQNARLTYLNADGGDLLRNPNPTDGSNPDITHLNREGDYINAIMMYEMLTGKSAGGVDHGTFDNHKFYHKLVDVTKAAGMKQLTYAYVEHDNTITYYDSLTEAANAAVAGDTLSLLAMPKSETPLTLEKGITVETFGSSENHTIVLTNGGNITEKGLVAFAGCKVDDNAEAAAKAIAVDPVTGELHETEIELPLHVSITAVGNAKPLFLGDTVTVTTSTNPQGAETRVACSSDALKQVGDAAQNADGSLSYTFKVVKITGSYVNATFTANAKTDAGVTASAQTVLGMNLRNRIHLTLKDADNTAITDATVKLQSNYDANNQKQMSYDADKQEYRNADWDVSNVDYGTIVVTLDDGRTAKLMTNTNGSDILTKLKEGTEEIYCEYTFPAYKVTGKLFFNGEPVLYDGHNQTTHMVSGKFGAPIPYADLEAWAKEYVQNTLDKDNNPTTVDVEIKKDGGTVETNETNFGDAGKLHNYVYVNAKTSYTVTFMNGETEFFTREVPYGENTPAPESNPTREGYEFLGWAEVVGDELRPVTDMVTRTVTYQAQWKLNTYIIASTLRINGNETVKETGKTHSWSHRYGGDFGVTIDYTDMFKTLKEKALEVDAANEPCDAEIELRFPGDKNRDGKLFNETILTYGQAGGGWNPGVKNTAYIWGYAWTYYDVTFVTPEGATTVGAQQIRNGNYAAKPTDPTKEGWKFLGWYADATFKTEFNFDAPITKKTSVYAKFELTSTPIGDIYVRYDVLHIKQLPDGSYDLANAEVEHLSAKKDTTVTAVVKNYSATHHINVNSTLSKLTDTAIQPYPGADGKPVYTILTVYYDLDFHTLTFDAKGGTETGSIIVRHGNTVAKPEDPKRSGYRFNGWFDDEKCREKHDFDALLVEDATVYAGWTKRSSGSSVQIESPNKPKQDNSLRFNTEDHFAFVNGYPDGTVKPTGDVTRAEVAAILYRVMDADCVKTYETTRCSFSDVVRGDWFNLYVATLENAGVIVDTRTNGKFRPNEAITRAELAAMLAQFADIKSAANSFNDVSARHWASDEIAVCAKMGWINGYPDGSFRPDATITRAEMMAMINRALGRTPKSADDLLSGMKTWRDNANVNAWYYLDVQEATNSHTYMKSGTHETWKKLH